MNAFEDIVKLYLEEEGYWVRQSVKVEKITGEDKKEIKLPTMPIPEIDIVALNVKENELLLVEVKSFLDSQGVYFGHKAIGEFPPNEWATKRYRLFADSTFQEVVTKRLKEQFLEDGLINDKTRINYALAVGKFYPNSESDTKAVFLEKGWRLFTPQQIKVKIRELANKGYEDSLVTITAKLTNEARD
jgi:hypothetical protein